MYPALIDARSASCSSCRQGCCRRVVCFCEHMQPAHNLGAPPGRCVINCCVRAGGDNRTRTHREVALVCKLRLAAMLHLRVVGMLEPREPAAQRHAFSLGRSELHNNARVLVRGHTWRHPQLQRINRCASCTTNCRALSLIARHLSSVLTCSAHMQLAWTPSGCAAPCSGVSAASRAPPRQASPQPARNSTRALQQLHMGRAAQTPRITWGPAASWLLVE
jgi:hypothetical protein